MSTCSSPIARRLRSRPRVRPPRFRSSSHPWAIRSRTGLAASLAHPGGNLTGLSLRMTEGMPGKWLELLQETVPRLRYRRGHRQSRQPDGRTSARPARGGRVGAKPEAAVHRGARARSARTRLRAGPQRGAGGPGDPGSPDVRLSAASRGAGREGSAAGHVWPAGVRGRGRLDGIRARSSGLVSPRSRIRRQDPQGRQAADLPIEQATKYVLVVNLKTAQALGLTIPESILERADEVIR